MYSADIYLSTSLYEGLPISILEAMSVGLPIIASDVTGNCDTIVNGKSGYLYNINDVKDAELKIKKLSKSDDLRKKALINPSDWVLKANLLGKGEEVYIGSKYPPNDPPWAKILT